jgi:spore maturation protein CgeB
MRILILNADYPKFLRKLYATNPGLRAATYGAQMGVRNDSLFGVADFYSKNFSAHGHEAVEVHVNNRWLQHAWARENGFVISAPVDEGDNGAGPGRLARLLRPAQPLLGPLVRRLRTVRFPQWEADVLAARVKAFAPDVILNQAMDYVRAPVLAPFHKPGRLIVGQIAAPRPPGENYGVYDLVISSLPNFVQWFNARGIRARSNQLAFEPLVLEALGSQPERDIPLSFVGSLSPEHAGRVAWLEEIARNAPLKIWGNGIERLPSSSPLRAIYQGEAWGRGMYEILRRSKITLNYHIDIAEGWANNMRLYEATGAGALLLTDRQRNLDEIYKGGEDVATYGSTAECLAMINRYLSDEPARAAIAASGQRRAIAVNNYRNRTAEIIRHVGDLGMVNT